MAKWKLSIGQAHLLDEILGSHAHTQNRAKGAQEPGRSFGILSTANDVIHGQRNEEYGPAERSFDTIAKLWNIYLNTCRNGREYVTAADVSMMMILLKVARTNDVPTEDSLVDICGYAALASECLDD